MASDIDEALRRLVADRARNRCEYCLLHSSYAFSLHQVDHILSRKHGGLSEPNNLALACVSCNAWKGSDLGSVLPASGAFVPLFDPRRQRWEDHFRLKGAIAEPLTDEGVVTCRMLKLNLDRRVSERSLLMAIRQSLENRGVENALYGCGR